jgi:methylated-DNA-[protein]-cysteine S-methyltransferase
MTPTAKNATAKNTTTAASAATPAAQEKTVYDTTEIIYATMPSPVGEIILSGVRSATAPGGVALTSLRMGAWKQSRRRDRDAHVEPHWVLAQDEFAYAIGRMQEYFRGERTDFDFEYAAHGTPFQERVWDELKTIPYGTTTTYGRITAKLGLEPVQARAVGGAIGNNPLGIVVPCHRVIGANGSLTGYAGGLENKEALLVLEGVLPQPLV